MTQKNQTLGAKIRHDVNFESQHINLQIPL